MHPHHLDVTRRPDGSIDMDAYKRHASDERANFVRKMLTVRAACLGPVVIVAVIVLMAHSLSWRGEAALVGAGTTPAFVAAVE